MNRVCRKLAGDGTVRRELLFKRNVLSSLRFFREYP